VKRCAGSQWPLVVVEQGMHDRPVCEESAELVIEK